MATRKSKKKKPAAAPKKKTVASKKTAKKAARKAPAKAPAKKGAAKKVAAKKSAKKAPKKSTVKAAPARAPKVAAEGASKKTAAKKPAGKTANGAASSAKKGKPAATYLGRADSMNASISLLVVDATAAADAWKNVDPEDIEEIERTASITGDLAAALDKGNAKTFDLGGSEGVGFQLSVGKGIAHVFRANGRLVVAEGFVDDVENEAFLGYVAAPVAKDANAAGTFDVRSGVVAMLIPGGTYEDLPSRLKADISESSAARIGSETPGLLVKVPPGRYRVLVESETSGPFGQAARAVLERE